MRRIKIEKWTSINSEGNEVEESLLAALNIVIAGKDPRELPKGIEKFQVFGRIAKAFQKAVDTGVLELEESDYDFLKNSIIKDVPSVWALNSNLRKAIETFLEAKEVE